MHMGSLWLMIVHQYSRSRCQVNTDHPVLQPEWLGFGPVHLVDLKFHQIAILNSNLLRIAQDRFHNIGVIIPILDRNVYSKLRIGDFEQRSLPHRFLVEGGHAGLRYGYSGMMLRGVAIIRRNRIFRKKQGRPFCQAPKTRTGPNRIFIPGRPGLMWARIIISIVVARSRSTPSEGMGSGLEYSIFCGPRS